MARGKKNNDELSILTQDLASKTPRQLYIFHGEERYLLDRRLEELRSLVCPDGLSGFNYRRFDGQRLTADELEDAIDTLPAFADKTLIEARDFDVFKGSEDMRVRVAALMSNLPDYVCIVFIYDTLPYSPDKRMKTTGEILKRALAVEFTLQPQDKLVKWIRRHFQDCGKKISASDAEYIAFITGGSMTALDGEIEKAAAYAEGDTVTRGHIDAVVVPALDAVTYKLADALAGADFGGAAAIMDELLRMREAPHRLMFSISLKMRQLLAARVCLDNNLRDNDLMEMCNIRYAFQSKGLFDAARKTTLAYCRNAVLACTDTAFELNNSSDSEECLRELLVRLAFLAREARR